MKSKLNTILLFFNELEDQLEECSGYLLHFLTILQQRMNYAQHESFWKYFPNMISIGRYFPPVKLSSGSTSI